MRTPGVVPFDPFSNGAASFGEAAEVVQPNALLFETSKEALDETILLGRIGRNELLAQPVIATGGAKAPALEDKSIVTAYYRCRTFRAHSAEARQASLLERPLGFPGTTAQREFIAGHFPVVTINNRREMAPAVSSRGNVRDIHCPALIAALRTASESMDPLPWRQRTLMHEPTFEHQQSIHRLTIYADPFDETQHRPQAPVTEGRILLDQPLDAFRQDFVEPRRRRSNYRARPQPGTGKCQHSAHSSHRYAGPRRHHSSDVPGVVGRLAASRRMSRSMVSSPTLRLSRLISSSRNASSSFWRARSAFSAPSRKRSRHSSTSATFSPWRRAASTAVVSPLSQLITRAARRLAVQRCTSSGR